MQLDSDLFNAWLNKGDTLNYLKKYEEALESFDKAIKIEPDNPKAWTYKGLTLILIEKTQEALECFNKSLEFDPDYEPAKKSKEKLLASKS